MHFAALRKITALIAAIVTVTMLASCTVRENFVQSVLLTSDVRGAFVIDPKDHIANYNDMHIASVNGYELYFDDKTGCVGVYDASSGSFWSALPTYANKDAAVITAEAFNGTATYILNSQDHAAAFGTVSAECNGSKIKVVFCMADKEETALKKADELRAGDIYISVPVEFSFCGSRLSVTVDMSEVVVAPGLILYNISVLPYFGAIDHGNKQILPAEHGGTVTYETDGDDFILVPDGCGAVVRTDGLSRYSELDFCVYGSDDGFGRTAVLGAFGIKQGDGALVCVDTEGEELAVIKTMRCTDSGDERFVAYSQYNVTPVFNNNGEMAYGIMYRGVLSQTYSFLEGRSASASGMAEAAREILILSGSLSSVSVTDDFSVNIELTGSVDGKKSTLLTTFMQAESILGQMKAKGIDKVDLILNGFFEGGLFGAKLSDCGIPSFSGGSSALGSLCDYAEKQGYEVYMGTNALTTTSVCEVSRTIDGEKAITAVDNTFFPVGKAKYDVKRISPKSVSEAVPSFLKSTETLGIDGYALCDLGMPLAADYTARQWSRSAVSDMLISACSSFASVKKLLVDGGNFFAAGKADVVTDLPFYTTVTPSENYEAVPFVQMILRSSVIYSGTSVSGTDDISALLKTVEYGGAPYFSWTGARSEQNYDVFISSAADFCREMEDTFGDLAGARMTDHYKVADGVFCTQYDDSALIYVNYNDTDVSVGDITVPSCWYIRIN